LQSNSNIAKEILNIQENISVKPETIEKLVELEQLIDRIGKVDQKRITNEFVELQRWLYLLYGTSFRISEDDLRIIVSTATQVHTLTNKLAQEDTRLTREREDWEARHRERRDKFTANIDDLVAKIDLLKT
jgi:hypothetical protein